MLFIRVILHIINIRKIARRKNLPKIIYPDFTGNDFASLNDAEILGIDSLTRNELLNNVENGVPFVAEKIAVGGE